MERLRGYQRDPEMSDDDLGLCGDAADLLDAIDALHQPVGYDGLYIFDCADCGQAWPCRTHRLLHPEEVRHEQ